MMDHSTRSIGKLIRLLDTWVVIVVFLCSCIRGSLLEVNDKLTSCPDLVRTKVRDKGIRSINNVDFYLI